MGILQDLGILSENKRPKRLNKMAEYKNMRDSDLAAGLHNMGVNAGTRTGIYGNISYSPEQFTYYDDVLDEEVTGTRYNATVSATPEHQALLDLQYGNLKKMLEGGSRGYLTNLGMEFLQPQLDDRRANYEERLANAGIGAGSDLFSQGMMDLNQSEDSAWNQLFLSGDAHANNVIAQNANLYGNLGAMTTQGIPQGIGAYGTIGSNYAGARDAANTDAWNHYNAINEENAAMTAAGLKGLEFAGNVAGAFMGIPMAGSLATNIGSGARNYWDSAFDPNAPGGFNSWKSQYGPQLPS